MIYCAEESVQTVRRLTIGRGGALLLIQHQLLHLFPQVLLVDARRVKGVAHKLGHPGARRHLFLFFLRWLGVTQTGQKKGGLTVKFYSTAIVGKYTHTLCFSSYLLYVGDGNWWSFWPDMVYKKVIRCN